MKRIEGQTDTAATSAAEAAGPGECFADPQGAPGAFPGPLPVRGEGAKAPVSQAKESAASWLHDHGDYLYCYALARVRSRETAEDLVQETLLGAMQSQERFDGRSSARTWLTSILRHKLADLWRRTGRRWGDDDRPRRETSADEAALERFAEAQFTRGGKWSAARSTASRTNWDRSATPADLLESEEFRRVLLDCLDKLPPRPAEAIHLIERLELNLEQVSNLLGVTTTHAGVILHRARLALRECLEKNWFRKP